MPSFVLNDYSICPTVSGRLVQVTATLDRVIAVCDGTVVADHLRCWAKHQVITDAGHVATAKALRADDSRIVRNQQRAGTREAQALYRSPGPLRRAIQRQQQRSRGR